MAYTRKRRYSIKKRSFRKRKISRKRTLKNKKYDKGHFVTLQVTKDMEKFNYQSGDTNYLNRFSIYWGIRSGGGV